MRLALQILFFVAGLLAALLVDRTSPNFGVVQGMFGLVVITCVIAALAFTRRR